MHQLGFDPIIRYNPLTNVWLVRCNICKAERDFKNKELAEVRARIHTCDG